MWLEKSHGNLVTISDSHDKDIYLFIYLFIWKVTFPSFLGWYICRKVDSQPIEKQGLFRQTALNVGRIDYTPGCMQDSRIQLKSSLNSYFFMLAVSHYLHVTLFNLIHMESNQYNHVENMENVLVYLWLLVPYFLWL